MRVIRLFLSCGLLLCSSIRPAKAAPEPMSPGEAQELLERAQKTILPPGSYRTHTVTPRKDGKLTTTTLSLRTAAGTTFSRTETVRTVNGHPEKTKTTLSLVNEEGRWRIYPGKALLMPELVDMTKARSEVARQASAAPGDPEDKTEMKEGEDGGAAGFVRQATLLAQHSQYSGEWYDEAGRRLARITRDYGPEGRRILKQMADEQIAKMKKEMSFGMRVLAGSVLAVTDIAAQLPVREVHIVDPKSGKRVNFKVYNASGKLLWDRDTDDPESIAELPLETFAVPAGSEFLRPKKLGEALELTKKLDDEEKSLQRSKK